MSNRTSAKPPSRTCLSDIGPAPSRTRHRERRHQAGAFRPCRVVRRVHAGQSPRPIPDAGGLAAAVPVPARHRNRRGTSESFARNRIAASSLSDPRAASCRRSLPSADSSQSIASAAPRRRGAGPCRHRFGVVCLQVLDRRLESADVIRLACPARIDDELETLLDRKPRGVGRGTAAASGRKLVPGGEAGKLRAGRARDVPSIRRSQETTGQDHGSPAPSSGAGSGKSSSTGPSGLSSSASAAAMTRCWNAASPAVPSGRREGTGP